MSWTSGSYTASHDLHFGTSNPPAIGGTQTDTTINPGVTMTYLTTYCWHIDEINSSGRTEGMVWGFRTGPMPLP